MSWLSELSQVYDNTVGRKSDDKPAPIYHISNNAAVTITIDGGGNFIKATLLDKDDQPTIMPCTEMTCAGRTSGIFPYPLCEVFVYIAGFSENDKNYKAKKDKTKQEKFKETAPKRHELYLNLLSAWVESNCSNPKIKAVYEYIKKDTIKQDIQKSNFSESDFSSFIRWEVEIPADTQPQLWKDEAVYKSWIDFYNSYSFDEYIRRNDFTQDEQKKYIRNNALNYVDGSIAKIASYHPAKIRNAGSSARIISSNDKTNYTFLGRFLYDNEACQISSEITQKAHCALRWLIKRQGVSLGDGLSVVTWNRAGDKLPSLTESSSDLEFDFGFDDDSAHSQKLYSTSEEFAMAMNNRLRGYYGDINNPQNIMIMVIKEATPGQGRVSIVLYRELQNSDMIEALENWYSRLSWYTTYQSNDKTIIHTIGTPSPKTIAECAYGGRVKPQLVEKTVQRILPSILDGAVIPSDIERQCIKSASNLLVLEKNKHDEVLETACAVFKYNKIIKDREEFTLALEENRKSRDYLYGRLLAVVQQYENAALRKANQERETNAIRYMQQFSMHPAKTWLMLYKDKLPAYRRHLDSGLANWFEKKIQDITALFQEDEYTNDKPLSGEFLLGYHCQLKDFRKNTDDESEQIEE